MIQFLEFCVFCYFFSFLPGYVLKYALCLFVFYVFERYQTKFLRKWFGIEFATGMDLLFNFEDVQNKSNIVSCVIVDKNVTEEFRTDLSRNIEKEKKYHKLKEILHHNAIFGYWKKHAKYNPEEHFEFVDRELSDEKELYEFMGKELSTRFPDDKPKWKFVIFKKFQKTKGAYIMKFHHSLVDGIAALSFFLNAAEVQNVKFVNMPKIGFWKWALIYLTLPFLGIYYLFTNVCKPKDVNQIHNFELSGNKRVHSVQIHRNLTELKSVSKRLRISINDLFTSVLMECLYGNYKAKFNRDLGPSIMFMPVSVRAPPPPGVVCPLNNTMITLFVQMKQIQGEDKEVVAKTYGKRLLALKNSFEAPILFLIIHYAPKILPNFAFHLFFNLMAVKPSYGFTNVPGPLEKVNREDQTVEKIFFYVPAVSRIGMGFSLFTYNNNLIFGVQADEKTQIDPVEFTESYQRMLDVYVDQAMSRALEESPQREGKKNE